MHIPEGFLPLEIAVGGYIASGIVTTLTLRKLEQKEIPKVALMASAFFVGSLINVPVTPSVHLVLNGFLGVVLGLSAFPAILVGLLLQAIFFQHGGLSTLGVNAFCIGLPALASYFMSRLACKLKISRQIKLLLVSIITALAVGLSGILLSFILYGTETYFADYKGFNILSQFFLWGHLVIMVIEAVVSYFSLGYIIRVKPELLAIDISKVG